MATFSVYSSELCHSSAGKEPTNCWNTSVKRTAKRSNHSPCATQRYACRLRWPKWTKAFEQAVEIINALPSSPDLVQVTGDLTHDTDDKVAHVGRMKRFQQIASGMNSPKLVSVPGEQDAGEDGGSLFRDILGPTNHSFDHRGIHFIALDNVSRAKPEVEAEQLSGSPPTSM